MISLKNSLLPFLCITMFFNANAQKKEAILAFNFGKTANKDAGTTLNKAIAYTDAIGYGFDLDSDKKCGIRQKIPIGQKFRLFFGKTS